MIPHTAQFIVVN